VSKIEELDKLDKAIKDAEVGLKSIQNNLDIIDNEIAILSPRKNELEQNIQFHKMEGSVPIAKEFAKSRAELSKVKARLILLNADRKRAWQASKDVEKIIDKFKKDYMDLSNTGENNVLRVLFGVNRGKK
jgi:flagellar biosynthesis chaperone FliJ